MANIDDKIVSILTEELKKSDVVDIIKNNKDAEKEIRKIVKDVIKDMFRVLWQHNSIFNSLSNA